VTPGSEPRHAAPETLPERVVEEIAEEIVSELDLHPVPEPADEPLPSLSEQVAEQLGGVRGLVESSVPVLVFVLVNVLLGDAVAGLSKHAALYWAIGGAVASAVAIGVYRLTRRQPVRHAVNGVVGIAVGAALAWRTGRAENFYLPGILLTLAEAAILVLSVAVRKPIIGYAWGVMANKGRQDWFASPRLFRTFQWLTLVWAGSLAVRAGVQGFFWLRHQPNALGVTRLLVSWPIYAATFAFTVWAIHRVTTGDRDPAER
jgi:Protein of unknown function (DUF3159)